jgi:predicted AAA+ superfamily ATPase
MKLIADDILGKSKLPSENLLYLNFDEEREEIIQKVKIKIIPLWKWLLLSDKYDV